MGNSADNSAALCSGDFGENEKFNLKHKRRLVCGSTKVNEIYVNFKWSFRRLKIDFFIALSMYHSRSPPNLHEF